MMVAIRFWRIDLRGSGFLTTRIVNEVSVVIFRFVWGGGTETSVKIRLDGTAAVVAMTGDRSQLPDLSSYRSIKTMEVEAQLFAVLRQCKLIVERGHERSTGPQDPS
jgi:hypothetical protein